MRRFKQFITETIDNLFIGDTEKRRKYVDQIWDILQHSYAKIGGIHGTGFADKDDMINSLPLWKVYRKGDTVKAVIIYKDKNGRKSVAMGTDGESDTKAMIGKMKVDEFSSGRGYGEVSDNALFFLIKKLKFDLLDKIVPYKEAIKQVEANGDTPVQKSLEDERKFLDELIEFFAGKDAHKLGMDRDQISKLVSSLNKNSYRRLIGKHPHTKVMIGNVNAPSVTDRR
jgi:hypothetical protein